MKKAKEDNANQEKPGTTPRTPEQEAQAQQAVDTALQNLQKAREELDGVNTEPLQTEIDKAPTVKNDVKYTRASDSKKQAYDEALKNAQDLIEKLTGKKTPSQDDHLDTKEAKQNTLDAALKKIEDAKAALDGAAPMSGYPLIAQIPSGSVDNGNAQAPATQPDNTGAAAPSTEAGAASDSSESDDASEAAAVAPSRTKGHGKHARIAQTSDPFAVGALAAPFAALAGALSLGAAGSRKRLRSAKHLKR